MSRADLELELSGCPDAAAAVARIAERLDVRAGRATKADRLVLDSFDRRLRAAGLRLERPARRASQVALTLHEPLAPPRSAEVADASAHRLEQLPAGALRDRLAPLLGERALLPVVRLRSRLAPLAVLDGDAKTVVRLLVEHPEVVLRGRTVALAPRVAVHYVRGYDGAFDRTVAALRDGLGLAPPAAPLLDEAIAAAGGRPEGVSSKVRVELAPGTRADVAAGVVLTRLAEMAEANLPGAIADHDPEFLHDLRVAIRRARSVLRELAGVHPAAARARVREELRWAQAVTGPVRDLDVQLLDWGDLTRSLPHARAGELEPLRALLARRRERELTRLRRALRSRRFTAALRDWEELANAPARGDPADAPRAAAPIDALAADRIRAVYRRMVSDGRAIDAASPAAALHDLRKRGKELRYLLELFGGLFPQAVVKPMIGALKDLQDVLGRFQDRAVQIALLHDLADELAAEPGGSQALMALGLVVAALESDQRAARDEFAARFAAFAAQRQRARVRATFPRLARP